MRKLKRGWELSIIRGEDRAFISLLNNDLRVFGIIGE